FFSSRRRHTRSKRDWSSDVCSSDLFFLLRLELQAAFAGALGQLSHAAMENIAAAVKHDLFNALGLGALGHGHADLAGSFLVAGGAFKILLEGGSGDQGDSVHIVDDLRIDVPIAAEHVQTRSLGCAGDLAAHSGMTLDAGSVLVKILYHDGTPPTYFLPPVLPSLRRMTSVVYLMPLPL